MKNFRRLITPGVLLFLAASFATARELVIPKGTDVSLVFAQSLKSKTARVGDKVKLEVARNVVVDGKTVLAKGTPVTGVIEAVNKRQRYGINARIRLVLNPVASRMGPAITLEPRQKGDVVGGKTVEAAAATAGGAILLGPLGLIGGYFIVGKEVDVHPGDNLETVVSRTVVIRNGK